MPVQLDPLAAIRQTVHNAAPFTPEFHLEIGWSSSYEDVFAHHFENLSDEYALLDRVSDSGRILLLGAGGGAKTVLLTRLAKRSISRKELSIPVFLKNWTSKHYDHWKTLSNYSQKVDFLLLSFAPTPLGIAELGSLPGSTSRLLLIDGLNEVTETVGNEVLDAVDDYVRYSPRTWAIVSDRFVRRQLKTPERWRLALVLPLSENEVAKHAIRAVGANAWRQLSISEKNILRSPYFLDRYLKYKEIRNTRAAELEQFLVDRDGLTKEEIDAVSNAAFQQYKSHTRTFELQSFQDIAGLLPTRKLMTSGSLVVDADNAAHFDHHLKHDYLVSRYVVASNQRWDRAHFRTMTFSGSSFDTVALAIEQLMTRRERDSFVRALYDWNLYAAGNALAGGRAEQFSPEMSVVVHAMFAERRWDIFVKSAVAATDILHVIDTALARNLLRADSLQEVLRMIAEQAGDAEWFREWKALYTSPIGSDADERDLGGLLEPDSVIGWTTSNVLRRKRVTESQQDSLRTCLREHDSPIIRWRAAHVLGRFASQPNAEALARGLNDVAPEVKYGCTRSLVEVAVRSNGVLAPYAFEALSRVANDLALHEDVVDEFRRVLMIRDDQAPPKWTRLALPSISALQQATIGSKTRQEWDRTLGELVDRYGY